MEQIQNRLHQVSKLLVTDHFAETNQYAFVHQVFDKQQKVVVWLSILQFFAPSYFGNIMFVSLHNEINCSVSSVILISHKCIFLPLCTMRAVAKTVPSRLLFK